MLVLLGEERGGAFGTGFDAAFGRLLGGTGTFILGLFLCWGGALLLTGASLGALLHRSARVARDTAGAARRTVTAVRVPTRDDLPWGQTLDEASNGHAPPKPPVDGEDAYPDVVGDTPHLQPVLVDQLDPVARGRALARDRRRPRAADALRLAPAASTSPTYRLPDANVLRRSRPHEGQPGKAAERTAEALLQALGNFGIDATLVGQVVGPRVTRYELQLAPGTKVGKVAALKDDLAYALATTEIRILAPIPGKQAVGVEVPNLSPNIVTLGDIFDELPPTRRARSRSGSGRTSPARRSRPTSRGCRTSSSPARPARGSRAASTRCSAPSSCAPTPDEVRMILVDPKRVELGLYESIPHLLTPVVSSPKQASAVLTNVLTEMERRYERMSLARARNLPELNRAMRKRGESELPYLLVVIDELADLMMVSPQEVEDAVIRLAQKSRAVGIHLVLATQRPSVDVITGMIKANVPSRIAFAVSSQTDSRVILDTSGAESLLGQGDMLFKPLGTSRLQRVQGAYVSEEEIALVVEQCRSQRPQELDESLLEPPEAVHAAGDGDEDFDPDEDPLLDKAIEIVVQTQTASVSLLQRRLRVGYTRAGRLVDMLERRGIISGYEGSKPRRVLVGEGDLAHVLQETAS